MKILFETIINERLDRFKEICKNRGLCKKEMMDLLEEDDESNFTNLLSGNRLLGEKKLYQWCITLGIEYSLVVNIPLPGI